MIRNLLPLIAMSLLTPPAGAASFQPLGDLPGGAFSSRAAAVSANGSVVVGYGTNANSGFEAFRWDSGGMVGLGGPPYEYLWTMASDVSADGNVVIGNVSTPTGYDGFRWTSVEGTIGAGGLVGQEWAFAAGISGDGSVIAGIGSAGAYRWSSADGLQLLGPMPGGTPVSDVHAISGNGQVILGNGYDGVNYPNVRWTNAAGIVPFSDPLQAFRDVGTSALSNDGSVIVGSGSTANGHEAFRWTSTGGFVGLGDLPGSFFDSRARGVSADGNVVVGVGVGDRIGAEPFFWTAESGLLPLQAWLIANGVAGLTDWKLVDATAISSDGQWVVGYGINPAGKNEAFRANISPVPAPGAGWLLATALSMAAASRRRQNCC